MTTFTMDRPVGETRLDRRAQGVIGKPIDRYEGALKVSGRAPYAYETRHDDDMAHGFLVTAGIGCGRIVKVDAARALAAPGVLHVVDEARVPRNSADPSDDQPHTVDGKVVHFGQVVCLVVAESFEQARHAAGLVDITYEQEQGRYRLEDERPNAVKPEERTMPPDITRGDFEAAFQAAEVQFDVTYTTPSQSHAAMEPHAAIAEWSGDELTINTSNQLAAKDASQLAKALGVPDEKVRLLTPYIGGGFGGKLGIGPEAVLAALPAKAIDRPVKVALARPQVFQVTSRRTDTIQRIRIGTGKDGRITAFAHETWCGNSPDDGFFEPAGMSSVFLYAGENRRITHRLAELNLLMASSMRAPGEAVGLLAVENAMDELAEKLGLDPIEFRKLNEPKVAPQDDKPFSDRRLVECMEEGARCFGWKDRPRQPGSRREGEWLLGIGMAAASRKNFLSKSSAELRLEADGRLAVMTDMTDIGTGSYTILAQIAGEMMGLPVERIDMRLGDTSLPQSSGSGGSWGANSAGSSVYIACQGLIEQLAGRMGVEASQMTLKDGSAIAGNRQVPLVELLAGEAISTTGTIEPGATMKDFNQASYGAYFCEVAVNSVTGETRVRRMLGVFEAGRILNHKTATSQCYGGMIFGIGSALTEELAVDPRSGLIVNHDLAEYHVPVNADVPQIEVVLLDSHDAAASPLASKGIGELAICGAGAAITNAIYNACGIRVRDYPMTLDKVLAGWAQRAA